MTFFPPISFRLRCFIVPEESFWMVLLDGIDSNRRKTPILIIKKSYSMSFNVIFQAGKKGNKFHVFFSLKSHICRCIIHLVSKKKERNKYNVAAVNFSVHKNKEYNHMENWFQAIHHHGPLLCGGFVWFCRFIGFGVGFFCYI